ncbi:hypothetical protein KIPB_014253, partial [Kipferlia bialata]|eukprot:g14253.t1
MHRIALRLSLSHTGFCPPPSTPPLQIVVGNPSAMRDLLELTNEQFSVMFKGMHGMAALVMDE